MMKSLFVALMVAVVAAHHPDEGLPIEDMVTRYGFDFEAFPVTTADGYICAMHNIRSPDQVPTLGPVLLQHGLLDSSDTWVVNGEEESLGFVLATAGYDVYLSNSRGNKHCKAHTHLDPEDDEFWDFSWDEMAKYDVPANVAAVLQRTGHNRVKYIGHSQGTTQMFAALTSQPDLAAQVEQFVALAPVAYVHHTTSPFLQGMATTHLDTIIAWLVKGEFLPDSALLKLLMPGVCSSSLTGWMCESVLFFISGFSEDNWDQERAGVYMSHYPSGTSTRNMQKWMQGVREDHFAKYDFGSKGNKQHYGSSTPPAYPLSSFPIDETSLVLISGGVDRLADTTDVDRLQRELPGGYMTQFMEDYDHLDFVWGNNVAADIYTGLLKHLAGEQVYTIHTSSPTTTHSTLPLIGAACACASVLAVVGVYTHKRRKSVSAATLQMYRAFPGDARV